MGRRVTRPAAIQVVFRMKAKLVAFGEIQIEGERYGRDVVIDGGRIIRRRKGPSKAP